MKPTSTQINFCRLTGMSEEVYQTTLFECGYLYAKLYWLKKTLNNWQILAKTMRETKEYWSWWSTQWNIRTQEAFGICGIKENEVKLHSFEIDALKEAFYDTHCENSYLSIKPNNLVIKALKQKIYGSGNNTLKPNSIKGVERYRARKSGAPIEL
jgi:hypothetical protein